MRLSAIIAARDAGPFLADSVDSALRELPSDAELIVVDDGSRDGSRAVLERYADRIRVLHNPEPLGPGRARNRGAEAARGEVLAFHDADDLVLPGRFTKLLAELERDASVDVAFGNGVVSDEVGRPTGRIVSPRHARRLVRRADVREMLRGGFMYPQALCVRAARFRELGGFSPEKGEDWDLALRASLALGIKFVDHPVFVYRRHAGCMTMRAAEYGAALLAVIERFVASHPELAEHASRREIDRAVARQAARCAKLQIEAGNAEAALEAFSRAVTLAPGKMRYRWRRARLRLALRLAPEPT